MRRCAKKERKCKNVHHLCEGAVVECILLHSSLHVSKLMQIDIFTLTCTLLIIFRNLAVPVKLSNFQIQLQYLVIVYFNFAVIYDIVVWSLELSGKIET